MNAKLIATVVALATGASAFAQTYWLKVNNGLNVPPKCFKFYSDEACKTQVSDVTPTANDGNTYIVLSDTSGKMTGSYTAPEGTTWVFGNTKTKANFRTNGGPTLNFGNCTINGIKVSVGSTGLLKWGGVNTLVNCGQGFVFEATGMDNNVRAAMLSGTFISEADVTIQMTRSGGQDGTPATHGISGDFSAFKGNIQLGSGASAVKLNCLELTSATAFGDASVERADYLTVENWTRWTIGSGVTQLATKGIQLSLSGDGTSAMYAADGASWTLSAPVTTSSTGGGGAPKDRCGHRDARG